MLSTIRTDSENPDFILLVKLLDADLAKRDGEDHIFYAQFNKIDKISNVIVAYENESPVGCGAIKQLLPTAVEIKRMYVLPGQRRKGIASVILSDLEKWALELSYDRCVLETGKRQPEAIALYTRKGYNRIPNYGQYLGVENSVCFEKIIKVSHHPH